MSKCKCGCGTETVNGNDYCNHHNFKTDHLVLLCPFNQQKCIERSCAIFNQHTYKCSLYNTNYDKNSYEIVSILRRWDNSLLSLSSRLMNEKRDTKGEK